MKKGDIYAGSFLKAEALKLPSGKYGTLQVTIAGLRTGNFEDGTEQRICSFEEDDRELGLNVTNFDSIIEITGEEDDDNWIGHKIELWVDENVKFKGKKVAAIRVRAPRAETAKPAAQRTAAKPAPADDAPPPDDVPADTDPLAGVNDKKTAWAYFKSSYETQGKTIPEITQQWKDTVKGFNKPEGSFTADDWKNVAEAADLPF